MAKKNPTARGVRQGFKLENVLPTLSSSEAIASPGEVQREIAAAWLVRRVPVSVQIARIYAEAHGLGGAR